VKARKKGVFASAIVVADAIVGGLYSSIEPVPATQRFPLKSKAMPMGPVTTGNVVVDVVKDGDAYSVIVPPPFVVDTQTA
jgi:hypothetical protein